jgi:hypothetical protein
MNGRKKEPWRRLPKYPFKPPQSASDPLWDQEEPKRPQEAPRRPQEAPRKIPEENDRPFHPDERDSVWWARWQDARDRRR